MLYQYLAKQSVGKTVIVITLAWAVIVASFAVPVALGQEAGPPAPEETPPADSPEDTGGTADTSESSRDGEPGRDTSRGEPGESADKSEEEVPPEDPPVIETGDAATGGEVTNEVNTNVTDTNGTGEGGEGSPEQDAGREETPRTRIPTDEAVENNNDATLENEVGVEAETGDNTIENGDGGVIDTGDAVAYANVINAVNTNIFNSEGLFLFLNNFFGLETDVDLRGVNWFDPPQGEGGTGNCGFYNCQAVKNLTLQNNNTVELTNSVVVRASTGGNSISGEGASINTGNAYAAANVVNLANTNIVDSNYLLLAFNNFGDWAGDIVFPAQSFFTNLFGNVPQSSACSTRGSTDVINNNSATVENEVAASAETGGNTIGEEAESEEVVAEEEEGDAVASTESVDSSEATGNASSTGTIDTGDASANVSVTNQINTNILCETSFSIVFQIHGDWTGNVFNAPPGVFWTETGGNIEIFGAPTSDNSDTLLAEGDGGERSRTRPGPGSDVNIENNNNANIRNYVEVVALTGENRINGGGLISTGNAQAAANIFNVANTNIVGRNWLLAVINIFGDWEGNISFGRPNLWLGASANVPQNPAAPGDTVTYTFTVMNNGDAPASNVKLRDVFDSTLLALAGGSFDESAIGEVIWSLGTIPAGGSVEVSYQTNIDLGIPAGETALTNSATVESDETDEDYADNADTVTVLAFREAPAPSGGGSGGGGGGGSSSGGGGGGGGDYPQSYLPHFEVTKTNDAVSTITPSSTVDYEIVVTNKGVDSAMNTVLIDTLRDKDGNVIHEEMWELGEVFGGEEITITYTTVFKDSSVTGTYTNSAQAFADDNIESAIATSIVEVIGSPEEETEELQVTEIPTEDGVPAVAGAFGAGEEGQGAASGEEEPEFSVTEAVSETNTPFLAFIGNLFTNTYSLLLILLAAALLFVLWRRRNFSED